MRRGERGPVAALLPLSLLVRRGLPTGTRFNANSTSSSMPLTHFRICQPQERPYVDRVLFFLPMFPCRDSEVEKNELQNDYYGYS